MRRFVMSCLLVALAVSCVVPAPSDASRRMVVRRGPMRRSVVVVRRGWPLRRPLRAVFVHPARVAYRVEPGVFLPMAVWTGVVVATPPVHDALVWEDAETLNKEEDWTEFGLNADTRGTKLWLEVASGKVQFDWAEVTFENGDARVVDMKEWTRGEGIYPLLDFADGRKVDHVRVVARAKSDEAKVALKMEK